MDVLIRIEECEREYKTINNFKGLITFQSFLSYKNPSWSKKKIANGLKGIEEIREALGWNTTPTRREKQRNPTPSRSTQLCYSCKVPWEPDHRCRGKGKKHIIEVHYDSDDEDSEQSDDDSDSCTEASDSDFTSEDSGDDSCTEASDACTLEEDDDPCVVDRQLDGQDDSTSVSADISHTIDDLTPQQYDDTSEDSHVLAPRDEELPMGAMAHLSPVQTPMIATSHEEISGMTGMMDELSVRDTHLGQVDPQVREVQDIQGVDLTHTGQPEEMESQLLETPLVEQVVEADRLMEHLLPGLTCIDEDALFSIQDDHSMCLDIAIWDPGADDSSRLSAQEDTAAHTGYSVIQGEIAPSDGVQWHTGVPSSTVDSGQFSTSSYAEGVFGDSRVGTSRNDYQQLLTDRDYLLRVGEMYHEALREQELEMDRLSQDLESTRGLLRGTQTALQELESRSVESLEEVCQQLEELLLVVPDDWSLVMTTGEHLSWIPMDELLVKSLGFIGACGIFHLYSQPQISLLSFSDTFIIDNSVRRIADEHRGLLTVISLTQEQLEEIGSDKLPNFPWDPGVRFVSTMFMLTQVVPESHTLHLGLVWSGSVGTCPMGRDLFFHLIIMTGHGDSWIGTSSTEIPLQIQCLHSRSSGHRYFSVRIQERRIQYICRGKIVMVRVAQCQHEDLRQRLAWDPGIAGLGIAQIHRREWTIAGESYSNFPLSFSVEWSAPLAGISRRSCSTSFWHHHVQLMEAMWILVDIWRMDSFRDEAMGQVQVVHRVDIFQDCSSQSITVHFLIWDPGGGVCYGSSLDGFYYVSHRWTWDPGILLQGIWILLEDKQFSSREDCNVPTLGHHHRAEIYDDQSSQMDARASTGVFERHCGVHLALMIIFHDYEPFRIGWLWFRCIPTISMILTILSYKSMEFTEEVILGTLLGGTSQCNSSLESGGAALQDGMARSDFQWPGKPQGEIRRFLEVKRLIN
jgi:hypothetical protein